MTITTAQTVSLLENVLFESSTLANANAAGWLAQHPQSGGSVYAAATAMATSAESGIAQQVVRYYQAALDRAPAPFEIQYYVAMAEQGLSAAQIAQGAAAVPQSTWNIIAQDFVSAPEANLPANSEWASFDVYAFYQNILNRKPSYDEWSAYMAQLNTVNPTPVAAVMQEFANSPEYLQDASPSIVAGLANNGLSALTGGNPVSAIPGTGIVTITASSPKSITEGSLVTFTIGAGLPDGTVLDYKVDGLAASALVSGSGLASNLSGSVTVSGGSAALTFLLSDLQNQGLSGNFTLSLSLPGYGGTTPLQQIAVPLVETQTSQLGSDPGFKLAGTPGDINVLLIDYANPSPAAYSKYVSGFQVLELGDSATGTLDVPTLTATGAPIIVQGPLTSGNVVLTGTSAAQLLTYNYASGENGYGVTLQMSATAAGSASTSLTVELATGTATGTSAPVDTLTLGGTFTSGDVVSWTLDGVNVSTTITSGETASEILQILSAQLQYYLGKTYPMTYPGGTGPAQISVTGTAGNFTIPETFTVSGAKTETATITHSVGAPVLAAPGYHALTIDTGTFVKTDLLQLSDTSLSNLTLTGAANLDLQAPDGQIATLNTTSYTGTLKITAQYAAGGVAITDGTGILNVTDTNLAAGATFSLTALAGGQDIQAGGGASAASSAEATIHISGGSNYIDVSGLAGGDTLSVGGTKNDIFLGTGTNYVTLSGTGGNRINLQALTQTGEYTAISGAAHGDSLTLVGTAAPSTEAWANGSAAAAQIKTGSVLTDFVTAATSLASGAISWFQFAGNTYVVESLGSTGSYGMVELTGLHDLSTATLSYHVLAL